MQKQFNIILKETVDQGLEHSRLQEAGFRASCPSLGVDSYCQPEDNRGFRVGFIGFIVLQTLDSLDHQYMINLKNPKP